MPQRTCFGCGAQLAPFAETTYTAHEFKCGKRHPELIPAEWLDVHNNTIAWERRSAAAKRGVETRRANGGKRAPRKLGV